MMFDFLIYLILLIIITGAIFAIFRKKKIPSPEESDEALLQLQKEIEKWQEEGIIEKVQVERILSRYLVFREKRKAVRGWNRIVKILSIFGAILIGIGVILFIAANWGKTPPWFNIFLLSLVMIGTYFSGWWLKYEKRTHPLIGEALIFLGSLLFGANLILITQLYHIRIEYSNLILVWTLAILPLAYLAKSFPILGLGSILAFSWGFFPSLN